MPAEISGFTTALACFSAEFVGLSVLVAMFVLAQSRHTWRVSTLRQLPEQMELQQAN